MISNRVVGCVLAALPLFLLASCGNQTTQSPVSTQDKKTELCTNLARFNTSVVTLKSMSPSSTVGDLKAARDQVKTAFGDVRNSASTVQDAKAEDLERAYESLNQAVTAIPDTATLNQASTSIAPQVAAVEAAYTQMNSGLNCP
jgi:hypothetical protein